MIAGFLAFFHLCQVGHQCHERQANPPIDRTRSAKVGLGDGLMVYFGWPRAHEDDAARAIRAGLEVTTAVSQLKLSAPLQTRVGIHTGVVVVGETGEGDASIPKAAVGETPNIAARLQELAGPDGVVVSDHTRRLSGALFDYVDLGTPPLKGLPEPLRVFRVVGPRAIDSRFEATRREVALTPLVGREERNPEARPIARFWFGQMKGAWPADRKAH